MTTNNIDPNESKKTETLLNEFAEYCHTYYTGCQPNGELWDYCYQEEIVNLVEPFLEKQAEALAVETEPSKLTEPVENAHTNPNEEVDKRLMALRLEVDSSIVDDLEQALEEYVASREQEGYKVGYTKGVIDNSINKDKLVLEARIEEHDLTFNNYVELEEQAFLVWCYEREGTLSRSKDKHV